MSTEKVMPDVTRNEEMYEGDKMVVAKHSGIGATLGFDDVCDRLHQVPKFHALNVDAKLAGIIRKLTGKLVLYLCLDSQIISSSDWQIYTYVWFAYLYLLLVISNLI